MEKKTKSVVEAIRLLLVESFLGGQEELRNELGKQGFDVTQSTVSRALKKLGAVRSYNENQELSYVLPSQEALPSVEATLVELVVDITANENMLVVSTKPGSASLIARHIDYNAETILGTIAGDDCILVIPESIKKIAQTIAEIRGLLGVKE